LPRRSAAAAAETIATAAGSPTTQFHPDLLKKWFQHPVTLWTLA
jgi:hypothetical protein